MLAVSPAPRGLSNRDILLSCFLLCYLPAPVLDAERGGTPVINAVCECGCVCVCVCVCVRACARALGKLHTGGSGCLSCYGTCSELAVFPRRNAHSSLGSWNQLTSV